ncbi:hypothetical protein SNE40_016091 [Patella caerulea]|uniref:C-type lectin domain-containing protein n=1 Tax=Patella caerulea TaxID=87958 RepID=A0AAN8JCI1_PATCE
MDNSYGTQPYGLWMGMRKGKHGEWRWIGPGLTKLVEEERWMDPLNGGKHAIAVLGGVWSQETKDGLYSCVCEEVLDMDMVDDRVCHKFSGSALAFFNYETRSCYYVFKDKKNWTQTRETCISESTYIVQPNTDEEKSWLMTILADFSLPVTVWLGKIRTAPGQWSWYYKNHLEVSDMVLNSGIDSADMSYARFAEDGQWQRATSTEIYGVVCEDSITPSHLKQARLKNVGGDWIYGEAWIEDPDVTTPVESSTDDASSTDAYKESLTTSQVTVSTITPTSQSTTDIDPKNSIFGYCPDPKWMSPGSIMDIKYSKLNNVDESVVEIMILHNASNIRCARTCSFDARCILYTRDQYKTCRGFKADRFSTNRISCSDELSCFLKICNDVPTTA